MRRLFVVLILGYVLALSSGAEAQACRKWTNWDIRGTYTMVGSGWIDQKELNPTLPSAMIPMSRVGLKILDGKGGGSGWVTLNAAGVQIPFEMVNAAYDVKNDCSVQETYSLRIKGTQTILGPDARLLVVAGTPARLELRGMLVGLHPGGAVDTFTAQRMSLDTE